jgi:hypothetical protein
MKIPINTRKPDKIAPKVILITTLRINDKVLLFSIVPNRFNKTKTNHEKRGSVIRNSAITENKSSIPKPMAACRIISEWDVMSFQTAISRNSF